MTLGADGRGLFSYYNFSPGYLKVAHCVDTSCSSATTATLDFAGNVGQLSSATIGPDGLGLISYWDSTNGDLKVIHCGSAPCAPFVRRR